ncbi:MAG TPA: DUF3300 domain-containing protein [Acidobacteriaceae bacterium]|nr:DUF3300 domain-containing protein [Acidobacteriaceae bacterium]
MNAEAAKKMLSAALGFLLIVVPPQYAHGYQTSGPDSSSTVGSSTEAAPMSASALQALVAPIALYPDALVAQILTASTFPDQIAIANYWLGQNKSLAGSALMQAVNKQSWDPSVKALTQFPTVLDNLATNLSWTSSLGEAYHNQSADVMTAVQYLRAQAQAKGNLKSTPQITVVQQSPQTIVIQSASPQVVYVPQYNPAVIYGYPYVVPGYVAPAYSTGDVVAASLLSFGAGIAVGAMMSGGCCGWGYSSWNCGWHGTAVIYHGGGYYGNSAWHGGYYNGGYHADGYNNAYNHSGNTYNSYHGGNTYNNNSTNINHQSAQNLDSDRTSGSNSWAQHDSAAGQSTAFSGLSGHSGGFGNSGGWSSRAESGRGWGSMGSSGFSGGRFGGGGGGGFGGGARSGGGGFRR